MYYIGAFVPFSTMPKVESSTPNVGMLRMWYINNFSSVLSIMLPLLIVITELNFADRKAVT